MKSYHVVDLIAIVLLIVGGINWGLVGLFDFDLISSIFGMMLARAIFFVMGVAAVYRAIKLLKANIGK